MEGSRLAEVLFLLLLHTIQIKLASNTRTRAAPTPMPAAAPLLISLLLPELFEIVDDVLLEI